MTLQNRTNIQLQVMSMKRGGWRGQGLLGSLQIRHLFALSSSSNVASSPNSTPNVAKSRPGSDLVMHSTFSLSISAKVSLLFRWSLRIPIEKPFLAKKRRKKKENEKSLCRWHVIPQTKTVHFPLFFSDEIKSFFGSPFNISDLFPFFQNPKTRVCPYTLCGVLKRYIASIGEKEGALAAVRLECPQFFLPFPFISSEAERAFWHPGELYKPEMPVFGRSVMVILLTCRPGHTFHSLV